MFAPKHILVPTDFSDCARHALDAALSLATQYGSTISVLHVIEPARYAAMHGHEIALSADVYAHLGETLKKSAADQMQAFVANVIQANVTSTIEDGIPYDSIVSRAGASECDLVVIGTHGRTGIKRFVMGSVAERVIRHAPCPVLTIR